MMNKEALVFSLSYLFIIIILIWLFIIQPFIEKILKSNFWEYGTCRGKRARRNKIYKNVQFVLWKAGEQGHKNDYWHDFSYFWGDQFSPDP